LQYGGGIVLLVKIEFNTGSFLTIEAGGLFQSAEDCREAFLGILNDAAHFFKFTDFLGRMFVINKNNINSIEVGYQKGAGARHGK